ncbi:MAG: peptidoglycan-binding protein LysM [Gammaproteobacteria bacterium]|jgi:nucleoid-associated protein YgaU|nr:peptidoglycan-binding protein LysM [Gammaproteobacteria bacterium]
MGLFDFMKGAGDNKAEVSDQVEVSQERIDQLRQESITRSIAQLDVEGEEVTVTVNGEVATMTGRAPSVEAMEKMVLCAGNQHGIGQVDCQIVVDQAPERVVLAQTDEALPTPQPKGEVESVFYEVKSGDTLSKIAKEHYGDANKYMVIFEANQPMLSDPDKIYPGQALRIPHQ